MWVLHSTLKNNVTKCLKSLFPRVEAVKENAVSFGSLHGESVKRGRIRVMWDLRLVSVMSGAAAFWTGFLFPAFLLSHSKNINDGVFLRYLFFCSQLLYFSLVLAIICKTTSTACASPSRFKKQRGLLVEKLNFYFRIIWTVLCVCFLLG